MNRMLNRIIYDIITDMVLKLCDLFVVKFIFRPSRVTDDAIKPQQHEMCFCSSKIVIGVIVS